MNAETIIAIVTAPKSKICQIIYDNGGLGKDYVRSAETFPKRKPQLKQEQIILR